MTRDTFDRFQPPERGRFGDNETAPDRVTRTQLKRIEGLAFHTKTDKALKVSIDGKDDHAVWVPRWDNVTFTFLDGYMCGSDYKGRDVELATITLTLPLKLAQDKGLA